MRRTHGFTTTALRTLSQNPELFAWYSNGSAESCFRTTRLARNAVCMVGWRAYREGQTRAISLYAQNLLTASVASVVGANPLPLRQSRSSELANIHSPWGRVSLA